jgi:hypothetical protein
MIVNHDGHTATRQDGEIPESVVCPNAIHAQASGRMVDVAWIIRTLLRALHVEQSPICKMVVHRYSREKLGHCPARTKLNRYPK